MQLMPVTLFNGNQTKLILLEMESIIGGPLIVNVGTYKVSLHTCFQVYMFLYVDI